LARGDQIIAPGTLPTRVFLTKGPVTPPPEAIDNRVLIVTDDALILRGLRLPLLGDASGAASLKAAFTLEPSPHAAGPGAGSATPSVC
jgi:hypothetical protein